MRSAFRLLPAMIAFAALAHAAPGSAETAADFYKGKRITVLIGTGPGTTYDLYARALSEHMGRHIPGAPAIVVQSAPGAGGAKAAQMLYHLAPKDGTQLGVLQPNLVLSSVLDEKPPHFDFAKFLWVGGFAPVNGMVSLWSQVDNATLEGARKTEFFMGTTGVGSETYQIPKLANALLGTKFKVLSGYKDVGEMELAMERGELHGRGGSVLSWTARKPDWIKDKKVVFLFQVGATRDAALPDVPLLSELVNDPEGKRLAAFFAAPTVLGRGVMTTPGVPAERLAALRAAFEATMKDPKFLAYSKGMNIDIDPISVSALDQAVKDATSLSAEEAQRARDSQK